VLCPHSLQGQPAVVVVLLLVWVLNAAGNLVVGMAWLMVGLGVHRDAQLPAPEVAEHGHETCRLVPIHPVLTFLLKTITLLATFFLITC